MRLAIDIANYTQVPSPAQIECLKQHGYDTVIVGASYGVVAGMQLGVCAGGGLNVEAYAWIDFDSRWQTPLDRALSVIATQPVKRLWLDAEGPTLGKTAAQVVARIGEAVNYVAGKRPDLVLGIYTGAWWWKPQTSDSNAFASMPLWMANYVQDPSQPPSGQPPLCGGWAEAAIWQYAGTIDTCGLNTDRNTVLEAVEEDMAAIELVWNPDFGRLYVLGQGDPRWVTDQQAAADLQAAYGPPAKALSWKALQALGAK